MQFLSTFYPNSSIVRRQLCDHLWKTAKNREEFFLFNSCVRSMLGDREEFVVNGSKVVLLDNPKKMWVRDGWSTGNLWSDNDFFIHGWQEK